MNSPAIIRTIMPERGVTILELMVSIAISAVLALTAIPQFEEFQSSYHRFNSRSYLIQDLRRAQAFTLSEGCRGIFLFDSGQQRYSFGCDYLTYDPSASPVPDIISFERELPFGVSIETSGPIFFNSRGESVDALGILSSITISLVDTRTASRSVFASGTLLGTGLFSFS